jgi:hypothetical protein
MNFSIRRYYAYLLVEGLLGLFVAFLIGALLGHFLATSHLGWLSAAKKTPWWDFSWIRQKSPWGFLIMFLLGTGFMMAVLQALWTFFQWLGCLLVDRNMTKLKNGPDALDTPFAKGIRQLFHPFRRIACLLSNKTATHNHLPSITLFDQRQRFLAENDRRMLTFPWKLTKFLVSIAVIGSWFLSLLVFYNYLTTVVSGQAAVNNLWIYFSSSFRIFVHIFCAGIAVVMCGLIANRLTNLYLIHLDNLVYDEVLPILEVQIPAIEDVREILVRLSERIERLERFIRDYMSSSVTR